MRTSADPLFASQAAKFRVPGVPSGVVFLREIAGRCRTVSLTGEVKAKEQAESRQTQHAKRAFQQARSLAKQAGEREE